MTEPKEKKPKKSGFFHTLFTQKKLGAACMIFLLLLVLMAIFADLIAPYPMENGAMQMDVGNRLAGSSREHLLGTDTLGQDVLSYLIYGARTSVILAISCVILSALISVSLGTLSAVIGGAFDLFVQRLVDAWMCIPNTLIMLIIMSMLGKGIPQMIFALAVPSGIGGSRMIRASAISVKDAGYAKSADHLGGGLGWKIIFHVIPNILPIIIIGAVGNIGGVVMMEASLNFLGFGVDVGTPSWGYLITNTGRANLFIAPGLCLYPGIAIMMMVFAANMFGDAVRDILDPRIQGGSAGSYDSKKIAKMAANYYKKQEKLSAKKAA